MKTKQILMLTTAALCGLAATRAGAEAAANTPMGYAELRLPGDGATTLLGINLIGKPPYAGLASAVGENTVTVNTAPRQSRQQHPVRLFQCIGCRDSRFLECRGS